MPTPQRPWPNAAVAQRDSAALLLNKILSEIRHLKEVVKGYPDPTVLRQISSDLHDWSSSGYRLLERDWPKIRRWPDNAYQAKEDAIEAFVEVKISAQRIYAIARDGQQAYLKPQIKQMAEDLSFPVNDALTALVNMGAKLNGGNDERV